MTIPEIIDLLRAADHARDMAHDYVKEGDLDLADKAWREYLEYRCEAEIELIKPCKEDEQYEEMYFKVKAKY